MIVKKDKILIKEIDSRKLYTCFDWPSEENQVWRHLTDYTLTDKNHENLDDMFVEPDDDQKGGYYARGTLLARPGSNEPSIQNVEITFAKYSIDFGKTKNDPARGYWVQVQRPDDEETPEIYYKMDLPCQTFKRVADEMELKVNKFLQLHDTIRKDYLGDSSLVLTHPMTSRKTCKVSVQEFHRKTNQSFDLDFIRKESFFVLNNLKATLDVPKSVDFLKSIRILGNKIKKKDFLQLFPELIDYYRSEDFLKKKLACKAREEQELKNQNNTNSSHISLLAKKKLENSDIISGNSSSSRNNRSKKVKKASHNEKENKKFNVNNSSSSGKDYNHSNGVSNGKQHSTATNNTNSSNNSSSKDTGRSSSSRSSSSTKDLSRKISFISAMGDFSMSGKYRNNEKDNDKDRNKMMEDKERNGKKREVTIKFRDSISGDTEMRVIRFIDYEEILPQNNSQVLSKSILKAPVEKVKSGWEEYMHENE